MSYQAYVTGEFALVDESDTTDKPISLDLADVFSTVSAVEEPLRFRQKIVSTDNEVSVNLHGISAVRGLCIYVADGTGTFTFRHSGDSNGLTDTQAVLTFATVTLPTVQTAATTAITLEIVIF